MGKPQYGDGLKAGKPGRLAPAMPDQDDAVFIDHDQAVEPELPNRGRDLTKLLLRVPPGIARVRLKLGDGQMPDRKIIHWCLRLRKAYVYYQVFDTSTSHCR